MNFPEWYRLVPAGMLAARRAKVAEALAAAGLRGLLITHNVDLYYLSGAMQQGGLYLGADGTCRLYVRRNHRRAAAESPLEPMAVNGFSDMAADFAPRVAGGRLGVCLDVMSARELAGWQKRLPGVELFDFAPALQMIKGVKDAFELECLDRAGELALATYGRLPQILRPGKSEAQCAGELITEIMAGGGMDLVRPRAAFLEGYTWHLVSGPDGGIPSCMDAPFGGWGPSPSFPHGASLAQLKPGRSIIVDVAVMTDGYMVDLTRTYCLGPAPAWLSEAHACLEAVEAALVRELIPGAVGGELFELAVDTAAGLGYADSFLGREEQRIRFVGHGVGLELGAWPYLLAGSDEKVRAGQVYALELKIVLPQGPVGLENTLVVRQDGPPRMLTPLPGRVIEVEV